jgi:hypothetical protein
LNFEKKAFNDVDDGAQIDTSGKGPSTPTKSKSTHDVGIGGDAVPFYGPFLPGAMMGAVPITDKDKYIGKNEDEGKKIDHDDI